MKMFRSQSHFNCTAKISFSLTMVNHKLLSSQLARTLRAEESMAQFDFCQLLLTLQLKKEYIYP